MLKGASYPLLKKAVLHVVLSGVRGGMCGR